MAIKPLQQEKHCASASAQASAQAASARSPARNTEIADSPFRSLQDVQTHLDSLKTHIEDLDSLLKQYQLQFSKAQKFDAPKAKTLAAELEFNINKDQPRSKTRQTRRGQTITLDSIDKVVIPKLDVLRKNFSIADELSEQADDLDKLYNSVAVNFRGIRGSNDMLKNVKALQKSVEMKLDKALKFLSSIGEQHTPKNFRDFIEATIARIAPELDFKTHHTYMYGYETKDQDLAFAVYLELIGLTDDEGNVYPKFYIVFNCVLRPSSDKTQVDPVYYMTVMHDFATPGKYGLGKKVTTPDEAANVLGMMLELENINTAIGTQPHNLNPDRVNKGKFKAGNRVAKIQVDPNALTFELLKSVKASEANEIAKSLYVDVKAMMSHIKGAHIKVKVEKVGTGFSIKFTLTSLAGKGQVSVNDIDFLKETFGLDDTKLRKVVKIINDES